MNHTPGAGSIARAVDQQFSVLPLSYGCVPYQNRREQRENIHSEKDPADKNIKPQTTSQSVCYVDFMSDCVNVRHFNYPEKP